MTGPSGVEDLLRENAPRVLAALVRRYGHFDTAEDAVQEALLAAATQWPREGVPENPKAWLITVASRRLTDLLRSQQSRREREEAVARRPAVPADPPAGGDDTLVLLFMCCHPALSPASQIAVTLRAVGGLTTAEIARAFLVPEATMTRRITRAKQTIKESGQGFGLPRDRAERLGVVLHVLYLIFNEGYATTSGPDLQRVELAREAIRLARMLRRTLPEDGEVAGLLSLMLLTDARRAARTGPGGALIPMDEQDRTKWDPHQITEGVALLEEALPRGEIGPYQLQAAIAALHDEAHTAKETDWPQIRALYDLLFQITPTPVVALNRVVAVAMSEGPATGLAALAAIQPVDHRVMGVRAHLLEMTGDVAAARAAYLEAAEASTSSPRQRYLLSKAARLK
ncbi:RNA polymerase sigma factor [Herbidospora mongoliensis]|uniref:RNA polymerase sigma factor n=1 Tax=Herbidospora mongoliensis TaxID=688067 RepID=UPI00082FB8F5|nr:sigma-70 family RNA polymerase sigma factor [Herbidospora mongoliensis]